MSCALSRFTGLLLCIIAYADIPNTCTQGDCQNGRGIASVFGSNGYQIGTYDGEFRDGAFHGKGTFTYDNQEKFVGNWRENAADGHGVYFSADGQVEIYNGTWKNDKRHGRGVAQSPKANGEWYSGEYVDDKYHGNGVLKFKGTTYNGTFVNGKFDGRGRFVWPDGGSYIGEWKASANHGKGVRIFATGATYRGEWKAGKMHGNGVYTSRDGEESAQHWENGVGKRDDGSVLTTPDFMSPKQEL